MFHAVNRCRLCGATSYRRVIQRDEGGALVSTSLFQCSGCSVVFADPKAWRDGGLPDAEGRPSPGAVNQASAAGQHVQPAETRPDKFVAVPLAVDRAR